MNAMNPWELWKKGFYAWENQTANFIEEMLKNPAVLGPSGKMLGVMMKQKAKTDENMAQFWGNMGLPTKRDQERLLHAVNQLQSRIHDLEEELYELRQTAATEEAAKEEAAK